MFSPAHLASLRWLKKHQHKNPTFFSYLWADRIRVFVLLEFCMTLVLFAYQPGKDNLLVYFISIAIYGALLAYFGATLQNARLFPVLRELVHWEKIEADLLKAEAELVVPVDETDLKKRTRKLSRHLLLLFYVFLMMPIASWLIGRYIVGAHQWYPHREAIINASDRDEAAQLDRFCLDKLAKEPHREALAWIHEATSKNIRTVGELNPEESGTLIKAIYHAGAKDIEAVDIAHDTFGETTNILIVSLPDDAIARKKLFFIATVIAQSEGFDPDDDVGQHYVFLYKMKFAQGVITQVVKTLEGSSSGS